MIPRSNGSHVRQVIHLYVFLGCYGLLWSRFVYLQLRSGDLSYQMAMRLRRQRTVLNASSGGIFDRGGHSLARSKYSGVLGFDPTVLHPANADSKKLAIIQARLTYSISVVAHIIGVTEAELRARVEHACVHLNSTRRVRFVTIRKDIPIEVCNAIRQWPRRLLGFGVLDSTRRFYACGASAAQVVGYVSSQGMGVAGLERTCGPYMRGTSGYVVAEVDQDRFEIPNTESERVPPTDGLDVHTTLDGAAQRIATEEAQKIADKYHPKGISIVIVEPTTGNVLTLVSIPTFDPNSGARAHIDLEALADRCSARLYEPSSTLKSLTIAAALDEGIITQSDRFYCSGTIMVGNQAIHCAMHGVAGGHGVLDARGILQHSCNVGAAQIGMKMGAARLFEAMRKFGLLDKVEVGLPGEQRGRLSFDRREHIYTDAKVARVAFGHSIATTPLHMAMAYASLVNGGLLMRPRLIASVSDRSGRIRRSWSPEVVRRVISESTSTIMCDMLRNVVTMGTGKAAAVPGYLVGGKTSTGNKYSPGRYMGSFIGFLPASTKATPRAMILEA